MCSSIFAISRAIFLLEKREGGRLKGERNEWIQEEPAANGSCNDDEQPRLCRDSARVANSKPLTIQVHCEKQRAKRRADLGCCRARESQLGSHGQKGEGVTKEMKSINGGKRVMNEEDLQNRLISLSLAACRLQPNIPSSLMSHEAKILSAVYCSTPLCIPSFHSPNLENNKRQTE